MPAIVRKDPRKHPKGAASFRGLPTDDRAKLDSERKAILSPKAVHVSVSRSKGRAKLARIEASAVDHIIPKLLQQQLGHKITFDPRTAKRGKHVLSPMVPMEGTELADALQQWDVRNNQISKEISDRMNLYFGGLKKAIKNDARRTKRNRTTTSSVWLEDVAVVASSAPLNVKSKVWTAYDVQAPQVAQEIFSILSAEGWAWNGDSYNVDLYKKGNNAVAVAANDTTLQVYAFVG